MEKTKGLPALLYQIMVATVISLVESGELDQGRAVIWIDNHQVNLIEEGEEKYRAEIVATTVEAEEE